MNMTNVKQTTSDKLAYLKLLQRATPKQRKAIIQASDSTQLNLIAECCKNFISGSYRTTPTTLKHLHKYRNIIRTLAKKNTSNTKRRQLLLQKGGFLSLLIPGAISLLGSLLGGVTGSS